MKKLINKYQVGGRFFGIATPEVTDNNIYYSRNSLLPEINITAKGDPRKVNNDYYKAHAAERAAFEDRIASREDYKTLNPQNLLEYTPVIGDALDVANIIDDASNKNYLSAGIGAGIFLLPNIIERPLKKIIRPVVKDISKWTPEQWTAAQDAAIARGNMTEAQRLRDLHFQVNAPNTQIKDIQYHGTKRNAKFNVFDPKLIGQTDQGWAGRGYYFTPSIDYAKMYGSEPRAFYINALKVHNGTASTYFGRENSPEANAFKIIRKRYDNDGQQILDDLASSDAIRTSFLQTRPYNGAFEEVVTRNNNQMKLVDAITYDDNGIRIPLGLRDNFKFNDIRYYHSPNRKAMKGIKYIEQTPSATLLDAEQQLAQRLKSYIPKVGENGLIGYKPLNSNDAINIPEEAVEKQIQKYIDSGMTREDAIERLREQFGYGAMTSNGKTFLLPEKYMITNPEYMKAHDAVHRVLRFDNSFNIPGAEGLNPNEAVAMISGEIKPALGIQANEPLTEKMLDKWFKITDNKITERYGFSSKIKDKKKFLEWANKVAPVWFLGGYGIYKVSNNETTRKSW